MCGIAGLYRPTADFGADELDTAVQRMIDTLRHRGPDAGGVWKDSQAGIGLGHRRLAIVDLSPNGSQPMVSESGRWIIVFNGEIYNFNELREELHARGYRFRGHSDTEALLAAIEEWGLEEALKRSVGMFALALWDRTEKILRLARDRIGEKPLYYGWAGTTFLFGSELKALRAFRGWQPTINREALTLFFRHNYIPSPYSVYQEIRKLMPATILTVGKGIAESTAQPYWSLKNTLLNTGAQRLSGSEEDATLKLEELLRQSIRGQMVADVPLGAFLSGGIDSSTIVALMQAQAPRPVQTFTIGFHEQAYDEAVHAKAVARHLGTEHTELYLMPEDAMAVIPKLPALYDEPFSDASQIPTYLIAELARRSVTVSLSGDGGDELFGGYNRYFLARSIWRRARWLPYSLRRAAAYALTQLSPTTWDRFFGGATKRFPLMLRPRHFGEGLYKLAGILQSRRPQEMYHRLISHWEQPTDIVSGAEEPPTALTDCTACLELDDHTEQMMYLDLITYLPDDILVKVDRASMGVSLESRIPLLDHRIVEFAWSLPLALKIRDGQGKWLLRQVLYKYVPKQLLERPKMGFSIPIGEWLRGPLREWAEALLDEHRLREANYLKPQPIREKWQEHLSGRRNWQYLLWDVLTFQAWLEYEQAGIATTALQNRVASAG